MRGNGQIDHDLLHLMLEIGGHGIGKRGVKAHPQLGPPVIAGRILAVHVQPGQVVGNLQRHARLGQILPDRVGEGHAFDFQVHGAVDQQGRLLDGQEDAVLKAESFARVVQVGHGGFQLGLVFHGYARRFLQPVPGRQFRRLESGLVGSAGREKQGQGHEQRQENAR